MAKTMKLLARVCFTLLILTGCRIEQVKAQNVFQVWFDTVAATAGDTVQVNVYYTFTSTHAHAIDYYQLRFQYDSSEVSPLESAAYGLAGTASGLFFDTTTSHLGITAQGQSELDTTNPVLIRIRFRVNRQLADTAFIRWDTSFNMFVQGENVDQVIRQDGWIRTATPAGHVVLSTPPITVHGITVGYSPDSVAFMLPVSVSNLSAANLRSALLSFTYDSTTLSLSGVLPTGNSGVRVDSMQSNPLPGGRQQVNTWISAMNGVITGGDTMITLAFDGLVGLDTVCDMLSDVSLRPTNADGLIGNTVYLGNPMCLEGEAPSSVTMVQPPDAGLKIYPNPATDAVRIDATDGATPGTITAYDMLGRMIARWTDGNEVQWQIPSSLTPGIYRVVCEQREETFMKTLVIER